MRQIIVLIALLFCFSESAKTQNILRFQTYGVDDGLSQSNIRMVTQDSLGYLWLGTAKGLNRFDGKTFKIYQPPKDTTQIGLTHPEVNFIIEDSNKMIWIATLNGLSKFNPMLDEFINFTNTNNCTNCMIRGHITTLLEDGNFIWVGTVGGLSRIHKTKHNIKSWKYEEGKPNGPKKLSIRELIKFDTTSLLIASNEGISIFNTKTETFSHINETDGLLENKIQAFYRDSKGLFWIGYETKGISVLTGTWIQPTFRHYPVGENGPSHGFIYDFEEDKNGNLWIATFNGLTIFNPKTETFQHIRKTKGKENTLASNQVLSLYRDKENRMWVGTQLGLNVYDPYLNQFQYLRADKNNQNSLAANETFSIFEDSKKSLWIGNYANGLTVIRNTLKGKKYFHIKVGNGEKYLSGAQVLDFEEDDKGRIWVATFNGINIIDWPNRNTTNYSIEKLSLNTVPNNPHLSQYIYMVQKGPDGNMWIGTHGAGMIAVNNKGEIKQYSSENKPNGITENIVLNISFDEEGRVWLAHNPLGFSVIENPKKQTHFTSFKKMAEFQLNSTHQIKFTESGGVLMSTDYGLFHFNDKNELFHSTYPKHTIYNEEMGLSDDVVYSIERIAKNQYWVSTGNGLSIVNTEEKTTFPITNVLGSINYEFNQGASEFSKDGTLYFGGVDGVVAINPHNFQRNLIAPRVYLSNAKILNEPILISKEKTKKTTLPKDIKYLQKLTLQPKDKIISFEIQPVNFTLATETTFSYILEGLDESWTTTKNPIITRSNLDPGNYSLLVKAANNDGVWSAPISLEIEMLPPWYRTWWAYVLFVLMTIGAVYLLLKLRLQQERKVELARAQERDIFRKRSSRDFHDEAGTRITRIALITELAKLHSKGNDKLQEYLTQIDDNLQDLNSGMRDFIWTLDPTKDNAFDTLTRFIEFAGTFCEYGNIQFKSENISENLKAKELNMSERRHLLLILKEAINNSIKHGKPTLINFRVKSKSGMLQLTLEDNGKGFNNQENSNGNGLNNMQERAKALGGALKIKSETNGGTKLTLILETTRLGN